jgi:hypothetical protein
MLFPPNLGGLVGFFQTFSQAAKVFTGPLFFPYSGKMDISQKLVSIMKGNRRRRDKKQDTDTLLDTKESLC